jgi:hypothetical protein
MKRLLFFGILLFFNFTVAGQIEFECEVSHVRVISSYSVTFHYSALDMSEELSDYWFSLNDETYKPILQIISRFTTVDPFYRDIVVIVFGPLNLKPGDNTLSIIYKKNGKIYEISKIIKFINPTLEILSVTQGGTNLPIIEKTYILHDNATVKLSYKDTLISYVTSCWVKGSKTLTGIRYKLGNNPEKPSGKAGTLDLTNFEPGLNLLLINHETEYSKTAYKTDTVKFFYTYFNLDPLFMNGEIWLMDTLLNMKGYPEGGWFTGNGIVNNSTYFNPVVAGIGNHVLTYHYPYKGKDITVSRNITVSSYGFAISGPLSVCLNSTAKYSITPVNPGFDYGWKIDCAAVTTFNPGKDTITIRWPRILPTGINFCTIEVTATHKILKIPFKQSILVYLKNNVAYDPQPIFFGDAANKLIICAYKDAYEYRWYRDGSLQATTKKQYYYSAAPGKVFMLDLVTDAQCITRMILPVSSATGYSDQPVPFAQKPDQDKLIPDLGVLVYPNPVRESLNIILPPSDESRLMKIFNLASQLVYEMKVIENENILNVDFSKFPSGRYFVQVLDDKGVLTGNFVKPN